MHQLSDDSQPNVLLNSQMAGYIYALYAICQNNPSGNVVFGGLIYTLSQGTPVAPPAAPFDVIANGNAAIALRCFMTLVGSADFSAALEDEFTQQSKLSAPYQCQAFMVGTPASPGVTAVPGLYKLLKQACTFTDYNPPSPAPSPPVDVPTSVLDLCQKFVKAGGQQGMCGVGVAVNVYNRMIQYALLDTTCPLAQIIVNIGQTTVQTPPYAGYPNKILGAYKSPGTQLDQVGDCFKAFLYKSSRTDTTDILSSLVPIQTITKSPLGANPSDPIYQLVMAILWDNNFNSTAGYPAAIAPLATFSPIPDPDGCAALLQANLGISPSSPLPWANNPTTWAQLLTGLQAYVYYL